MGNCAGILSSCQGEEPIRKVNQDNMS